MASRKRNHQLEKQIMASTDYDWYAFNEDASAWHAAKQKEMEADEQCIDEDEV